MMLALGGFRFLPKLARVLRYIDKAWVKCTGRLHDGIFMKHLEILASLYFVEGLRQEAGGLAIVACALLIGGFFIWRVTRFLKKEDAEELEREQHGENLA